MKYGMGVSNKLRKVSRLENDQAQKLEQAG